MVPFFGLAAEGLPSSAGPQLCMQLFEVVHRDTVAVTVLLESPICHALERKARVATPAEAQPVFADDYGAFFGFRNRFLCRSRYRGPPVRQNANLGAFISARGKRKGHKHSQACR